MLFVGRSTGCYGIRFWPSAHARSLEFKSSLHIIIWLTLLVHTYFLSNSSLMSASYFTVGGKTNKGHC